jgi:hypothetical protein
VERIVERPSEISRSKLKNIRSKNFKDTSDSPAKSDRRRTSPIQL